MMREGGFIKMSKESIYYAADGTRFSSVVARNNYDKKLKEKEKKKKKGVK